MQKIYSTIFKTLNSDLTVFNKTLISTKDHLKALETVNATVYNKNGAFNLQGLLVNSSQSVSTFTKLNNAFKAYNGNLSKSTQLQNAYVQAVGKQNTSLGNYLAGLNGAKASMGGYIKSLVAAKAASIGLQVASVALNTAISMGITLAISALISAITKWVNKEKEAREEAIENAKAAKEESNNLSELLNRYNQLSKEVKSNQGVKEDLLSVQSDLLEALGIEASQIDTLIEKYGDLDSAINQITLDSLRDAQGDLMVAVDAYEKELINVGKGYAHWYSFTDRNMLSAGSDSVKLFNILEKAGIISSGSYGDGGGSLILTGNDKTVEGILENYQKLKDAQEALNTAIDNGEVTMEEMISNSLYKSINARLDELKNAVDNYDLGIDDINETMAQQQILKSLAEQSSIPETKEEFDAFQQSMIDTAIASTKFKGSQDDIRDSIINVLSVMPEFEKYFEELNDVQSSTLNNKNPIQFDFSTHKDTIDNFQSKMKTLGDTLSSIRLGNFEDSDLTDLFQEFPELADKTDDLETAITELIHNSLEALYATLGEEIPDGLKLSLQETTDLALGTATHLSDAFSSIHDSWDILQDFKEAMEEGFDDNVTDDLLQSVRGLSGELETLVAGYYSGVVTAEELYDALTKHYENDLQNYSTALIKKNELNETFYNAVGMASEEVTNQFLDDYNVDLKNCKNYNQAKLEIEKQTLGKISGAWAQYYDAQSKTLKISMGELEARAAHGGGDAAAFLEQYELIENYEKAIEDLNKITYDGLRSNFESIGSRLDRNKDSSKDSKDTTETFNWIETAISRIQRVITNLGNAVSATWRSWTHRNTSLASELAEVRKEIELQQSAYEAYMKKAESVSLSDHYKNLVRNGDLSIEDIADETLKEQIKEYQEWWIFATLSSNRQVKFYLMLEHPQSLVNYNVSMKYGYA